MKSHSKQARFNFWCILSSGNIIPNCFSSFIEWDTPFRIGVTNPMCVSSENHWIPCVLFYKQYQRDTRRTLYECGNDIESSTVTQTLQYHPPVPVVLVSSRKVWTSCVTSPTLTNPKPCDHPTGEIMHQWLCKMYDSWVSIFMHECVCNVTPNCTMWVMCFAERDTLIWVTCSSRPGVWLSAFS